MEGLLFLVVLLLAWVIIAPIVAMVKANLARSQASQNQRELSDLKQEVQRLKVELRRLQQSGASAEKPAAPPVSAAEAWENTWRPPVAPQRLQQSAAAEEPATQPAPIADVAEITPLTLPAVLATPPPLPQAEFEPSPPPAPEPSTPPEPPAAPFSLEHFMGVKLFAWLGGVALFFGVIFFVKYAFERNLIPPAMRIALGLVTGAGVLVGGLVLHRRANFLVLAHAFCATGVLILYGVSFAAKAVYHPPIFSTGTTFALMALITVAAFLIAVRLNALVVAVLGMLGGFITPVLLSTGQDQLLGLSGYIALLVIGLAAVSRHRNWWLLVPAAALGTALMQLGWFAQFFEVGHYDVGAKTLLPMGILLFFVAVFTTVAWLEKRREEPADWTCGSALGMSAMALLFAFVMLGFSAVAGRLPVLFGFLLLQNLAVLGVVWLRPKFIVAQVLNCLLTFLLLAIWTNSYLRPANLVPTLAVYLLFGTLHAVVPVALTRLAPETGAQVPARAWPWATTATLLLLMLPLIYLPEPALVVWFFALLVNLLAILLAARTGAVLPVLGVLLATLLLAVNWLFKTPVESSSLTPVLGITLGFSALFTLAGRWLAGQADPAPDAPPGSLAALESQVASALPVLSGVLPFGLLLLAIDRLPIANPSAIFAVALVLVLLLLGLAVRTRQTGLAPAALGGMLAVQALWHSTAFNPEFPAIPLLWNLGCYGLFLGFPFAFRRVFNTRIWPWITAAVAGIGYFLLVHNQVQRSFPAMAGRMGLVPVAFAIPSLLALVVVVRMAATMEPVKRNQLAWFGGVALFFITLVFPIQFHRQWLTISWAVEGALLLWLFHRVRHAGLTLTGLGLLAIAFFRLVFNGAVFTDYPRSAMPILNWHLYTYGTVAAAQFLAARWFSDPERHAEGIPVRAILYGLGGVLLFLLLNIEIADYFTPPGRSLVSFASGVNFARDMTFSIAWGLFALGLLILGIWCKARPARYAAIGLMVITLLKLFLHDLSSLASIFRIGALIGVAVIAFIASFLYQQFFNRSKSS